VVLLRGLSGLGILGRASERRAAPWVSPLPLTPTTLDEGRSSGSVFACCWKCTKGAQTKPRVTSGNAQRKRETGGMAGKGGNGRGQWLTLVNDSTKISITKTKLEYTAKDPAKITSEGIMLAMGGGYEADLGAGWPRGPRGSGRALRPIGSPVPRAGGSCSREGREEMSLCVTFIGKTVPQPISPGSGEALITSGSRPLLWMKKRAAVLEGGGRQRGMVIATPQIEGQWSGSGVHFY